MVSIVKALTFITASGLLDNTIQNQDDALYEARQILLAVIYENAWINTAPYTTWMQNNRVFFIPISNLDYVISNKTYQLTGGTIYAMDPNEYTFVEKASISTGVGLTASNFAAWAGAGSTDTFYW